MALRLRWEEATGQDRPILQAFSCTPRPGRDRFRRTLPYERGWEREIEAGLRQLTPPIGDGVLQLGFDESGLAAISLVAFVGANGDHYVVKLRAAAVDLRCRRRGFGLEAVEVALRAAGDQGFSLGYSVVDVVGQVYKENHPSKAMLAKSGLGHLADDGLGDDLEEWGTSLEGPLHAEDA